MWRNANTMMNDGPGAKRGWTSTLWSKQHLGEAAVLKNMTLSRPNLKDRVFKIQRHAITAFSRCNTKWTTSTKRAQDQHQFANELGKRKWGGQTGTSKPHTHTYKSCLMVQIEMFALTIPNGYGCVSTHSRLVNECKHYLTAHWAFPTAWC